MIRGESEIKRVENENPTNRQVTFSSLSQGLLHRHLRHQQACDYISPSTSLPLFNSSCAENPRISPTRLRYQKVSEMGALAPAAPWIPEDDLLLKNSVEAGASLESLAKGAVQFSRRYNIRELQERWYCLLYDPVISAEASAHMIEFDRSAQTLTSKFSKIGNSKENKIFSGKRKAHSVRSCYYALRKRICNEPLNGEDFNYIVGPSNGSCLRTTDDNLTGDYMLCSPGVGHLVLQESDHDMKDSTFPDILMHDVITTTDAPEKDVGFPADHDDLSKDMPGTLGACHPGLFDTSNLETEPFLPAFAPINQNEESFGQDLQQNHEFNSPILDCGEAFHGLDCSSPLADMPIWKTVEGISTPNAISLGEKHLLVEEAFSIEDVESKNVEQPVVSTEGYLEELSKSLLNFTNEEELFFMDADAKDVFEKSYYDGLRSLLLNSPVDANHEACISDFSENVVVAAASNVDSVIDEVCRSECCIVPSMAGSAMQSSVTCDEFIFCSLNTEDPDIPCNDDVTFTKNFAPSKAFTKANSRFQESCNSIPLSSLGELTADQRVRERGASIPLGHYRGLPQPIGSKASGKNAFNPTSGSAHGIKCEVSNGNIDANLTDQANSSTVRMDYLPTLTLRKETLERDQHVISNPTDSDKFQNLRIDGPQEVQNPIDFELGLVDPACLESGMDCTFLAPKYIESDEDLPSFSDIEAMVLDMDLDPDDQDFSSNEEVLRYDNAMARRTILRLEQGARSYMQRAMAYHGAFAILYGQKSKHYIRKQEVLLGRATGDIKVDIDLGKEGRFNKISRRQAIIELKENGSFLLKNLGNKFPILVNNRPVAPGLDLKLTPNCLIEIRGMPFIFDINPSCVKQFLEHTTMKQQHPHSQQSFMRMDVHWPLAMLRMSCQLSMLDMDQTMDPTGEALWRG
ncbi:hypothetical protein SAY87_012446 [Trapa incisa]|uniref:FHA domain-containing protein n=1 Tax=Trapa incisa TaxID=236973 RepID=A0AAN7GQ94_9MYRT|nr:hypothetical protein SAY87_012446 [Trapa incisa]